MNKEFIPYELALALKELGFDEECFAIYQKNKKINFGKVGKPLEFPKNSSCWNCSAPTYSQAFKWFRGKHGLYTSGIDSGIYDDVRKYYYKYIYNESDKIIVGLWKDRDYYNTYEEAELACLKKLIEIVKEKV